MIKTCVSCQTQFEAQEDWKKVCIKCFKQGKVPKSPSKQSQEDIINGLRQIYIVLSDIRKILQGKKEANEQAQIAKEDEY